MDCHMVNNAVQIMVMGLTEEQWTPLKKWIFERRPSKDFRVNGVKVL
jgi:hypothetical protein